jgi:hypothetical protein
MTSRVIIGDSIVKHVRNINDCNVYSLSGISLGELPPKIDEIMSSLPTITTLLIHCGTNNLERSSVTEIMQKFQTIIDQTKLKYHRTSLLISSILP